MKKVSKCSLCGRVIKQPDRIIYQKFNKSIESYRYTNERIYNLCSKCGKPIYKELGIPIIDERILVYKYMKKMIGE